MKIRLDREESVAKIKTPFFFFHFNSNEYIRTNYLFSVGLELYREKEEAFIEGLFCFGGTGTAMAAVWLVLLGRFLMKNI